MAKDNSGSLMVAFVIGALTGAAVALLYAPATRDAMDQGREYYSRNRENLVTAVERGREAFQQARERGDQV
jgi:gas vesicle protein